MNSSVACFLVKFSLSLLFLNKMESGKCMDFIYFSLFTILVNFLDQLVTDMSELVLKIRWEWVDDDRHFPAKNGRTL